MEVICIVCKVDKTPDWFHKNGPFRMRSECRVCRNTRQKECRSKAQMEALQAYGGPVCAVEGCGEKDILKLHINHIHSLGTDHRIELFGRNTAGHKFWIWLKQNGWPKGYNVLCKYHNSKYKPSNLGEAEHA